MLTPSEIEALRGRAKENSAYYRKAFAHLKPIAGGQDGKGRRGDWQHRGAQRRPQSNGTSMSPCDTSLWICEA
jgi:hypothetical protein